MPDTVQDMVIAFIRRGDGSISRDNTPAAIASALRDPGTRMWIDLEKPSPEEVSAILDKTFDFHPLAIEDSTTYTQRPKVEHYSRALNGDGNGDGNGDANGPGAADADSEAAGNQGAVARTDTDAVGSGYCYVVFHGPDLKTFRESLRTKEINMFLSPRYIVSIHDEPMTSVLQMRAKLESDPDSLLGRGTDVLLYGLLDRMVDHYQPILDYLEEAISDLEDQAVDNPRPEVLARISQKKRELLNLRRIVGPQREVVAVFARGDVPFVREGIRVYFRDVQDHLVRIVEMVELYRDLIQGARDIYLSSISNHLNQIMKTLTIISVVALPLTVVTSFFGMNFDEPIFHDHRVFIGALLFMMLTVGVLLYLFRRYRWL